MVWRTLAVALLLVVGSVGARPPPHNASTVKALRQRILNSSEMDQSVPPSVPINGQGNQVWVQFRVFKVLGVDLQSGRLRFKAWRRTRWFDDRLKWDPEEFGGIKTTIVYPGQGKDLDDNLWLPDIVTYNSAQLDRVTYEAGAAWIRYDGRVHHSVAGLVDITCRYSGLVNFPRDELTCPMEVAMWSTSDLITNLTFFDDPNSTEPTRAFVGDVVDPDSTRQLSLGDRGCAVISPQSAATAPSYQEFQLAPRVDCLKYTRLYPCCANEPWTQLWIVFHIQRSSNYYVLLIEAPSIAITLLSFGQFWMDASAIGARLGFGATMFLTSYVLLSVSEDSLPRCGELLWINYLNVLNLAFCVIALIQTVITVHLCFGRENSVREAFAEEIDFWSRRFIPVFFFFAIMIVYALEPVDPYSISTSEDGQTVSDDDVRKSLPMYQGLAPNHKLKAWRVVIGFAVSVVAICASLVQRVEECDKQAGGGPRIKLRIQLARTLTWKAKLRAGTPRGTSSIQVEAPPGENSSRQSSSD